MSKFLVKTVKDEKTGLVLGRNYTKINSVVRTDDSFIFIFDNIIGVSDLVKSNLALLVLLCMKSESDTGVCPLNSARREEYAEMLGLKVGRFNNKITELVKAKVITLDRGNVYIDPNLMWKGRMSERQRELGRRKKRDKAIPTTSYSNVEIKSNEDI